VSEKALVVFSASKSANLPEGLPCVFLSSSKQILENYLNTVLDLFIPHPSQFSAH
jgi:hypothetical protein